MEGEILVGRVDGIGESKFGDSGFTCGVGTKMVSFIWWREICKGDFHATDSGVDE